MKKLIAGLGGLVLASVLAACGGGGGSSPVPGPVPTATPQAAKSYSLRWTGVTHSSASSVGRSPLDTSTLSEAIELAASGGHNALVDQTGAVFGVVQVVVTQGGVVVAPVNPTSVAVTNATLASAVALPTPSGSPSPGPLNIADIGSTTHTGATTFTATMPDGTTPSTAVNVYTGFAMECPAGQHPDAVQAYKVASGALVTASGSSDGDVYFTDGCGDTIVHFPYGYSTFQLSTPFSSITTALPFTSLGASVNLTVFTAGVTAATNPLGGIIFKTVGGDYVKVRFSGVGGTPQFAIVGAASVGPGGIFPS